MTDRGGRFAGDRLYYRAWDHQTPRAHVVVAHGVVEHSGRYEHVAARLQEAGCAVWALDHRGHGQSEGARADIGSIQATVDDLDLFVDLVAEAAREKPLFLVGHSMGGLIATAYAEQHQDRLRGLALSAPVLVVPPEMLALADLDEIPDIGLADAISSDPAVVAAYRADPLVHQLPPPPNFFRTMHEAAGVREALAQLTLPILVMHGSGDLLVPAQALREVVVRVASEDVTARVWPRLFHEIFNEPQRDAVLDLLVSWITEHLE
ncbi:MAG: ytpA 1 [Acidimicrobiales bacterium]|nr:ytpA 1 [Acidimicrobiales bacterium]